MVHAKLDTQVAARLHCIEKKERKEEIDSWLNHQPACSINYFPRKEKKSFICDSLFACNISSPVLSEFHLRAMNLISALQ